MIDKMSVLQIDWPNAKTLVRRVGSSGEHQKEVSNDQAKVVGCSARNSFNNCGRDPVGNRKASNIQCCSENSLYRKVSFSVSSMTQHSNLKQNDFFGQRQSFEILQCRFDSTSTIAIGPRTRPPMAFPCVLDRVT